MHYAFKKFSLGSADRLGIGDAIEKGHNEVKNHIFSGFRINNFFQIECDTANAMILKRLYEDIR